MKGHTLGELLGKVFSTVKGHSRFGNREVITHPRITIPELAMLHLQHVPLLVGSAMKVNRVFFIAPEPFELQRANGEAVSIAPPCSWSGLAPVQVRLLSSEWREGQVCIVFSLLVLNPRAQFTD